MCIVVTGAQGCLTSNTAASIMVGGNWTESRGNPQPSAVLSEGSQLEFTALVRGSWLNARCIDFKDQKF